MGVYQESVYEAGGAQKPLDEIDPTLKNGVWVADRIRYIYNQYLSGHCAFTPDDAKKLELYRLYAAGKQPTDIYRESLTYETTKGNKQSAVSQRKAYHNINWNSLMSPMPKYVRKIEGMFLSQDHDIVATATNEKARVDKFEKMAQKYVGIQLASLKKKVDAMMGVPELAAIMQGFVERDMEEIQILSNAGEYKLPYEAAGEMVVEHTMKISNFDHARRKLVRDIICSDMVGLREVIRDNHVVWEYADPANVILPYSSENHFNDIDYGGYQEWWKINDLRKKPLYGKNGELVKLNEKELREIAMRFHKYNHGDKRAFKYYDKYYSDTDTYGYDDYIVPVIYGAFKSVDTEYSYKFKVAGEERIAPGKWGISRDNTIIDSTDTIYHGRWIPYTDYHFDCGMMNEIPRNSAGKVLIPFHFVKLDGSSIMENSIPILDQYAMLGYRFQNAWAQAVPTQFTYDWTALENISSSSGGKLDPFDIVRMHLHGAGVPFRSKPLDSDINYPISAGIARLEGGIGTSALNEFIVTEQMLDAKLVSVTGIPAIETAGERTPVAVARMAVAAMSDVLKPRYDIYINAKEKVAYNTVYRVQIMLKHSEDAFKFYADAIGTGYAEYLKMAYDTEPASIGVMFEALATEEMKQATIQAATTALQGGKNGVPLLRMSEYIYLVRNINTPSGLKAFELLLRHREIVDDQLAQQRAEANQQAQSQAIQDQITIKGAMTMAETQAKGGLELMKIKAQRDLDLRNDLELQGNEMAANAYNKGVDMAIQQFSGQGQPQGQTQTQTV